jgi:hypothetical protein
MAISARPFISYAREDQGEATRLADDLRAHGVEPWVDVERLLPGQNWKYAIRDALRSSTHVVALLSHSSVSKRGYVQKELKDAIDLLGEFRPDEIFLIPVRLEAVEVHYEQLREIQHVDIFTGRDAAIRKILAALTHLPRDTRTVQPRRNRVSRARRVTTVQARRTAAWVTGIGLNDLLPEYRTLAEALNKMNIEPSYLFSSRGASQPPPIFRVIVAGRSVSVAIIQQVSQAVMPLGDWYLQLWDDDIDEHSLAIGAYGYGGIPAACIDKSLLKLFSTRSFTRAKLRTWIAQHGIMLDADYRPKEE